MEDYKYEDGDIITLVDEDGAEFNYEIIGICECEGHTYLALVEEGTPEADEFNSFVIMVEESDPAADEANPSNEDGTFLVKLDVLDDEYEDIRWYFEENLFE